MRKIGSLFASALAFCFLTLPLSARAEGLTFLECYRAALKRSETVGIQDQAFVQANELEKQARAILVPQISANATFLRQQPTDPSVSSSQDTIRLTGTQTLFHGFREFALIHQRSAQSDQQKALLKDAARSLFYDVADAYYGRMALEADERNYGNELEVNRRRLKDLEGFRRVGRSRTSEVLSQRANIASLEAALEAVRGQLSVQREVLAFLDGLPPETPLKDSEAVPSSAEKLDAYLAGITSRADLEAGKAAVRSAESAVSASRSYHWPAADLNGNYYLQRPTGILSNTKWDVSLLVSFSIFQGGAIQSQVRQSVSLEEQATLQLSRAQRLADEEVRRFFDLVISNQVQLTKLDEFADLSRQNYEAQQRDYSHGLVTNLEVLQATSSWQVALRTRERQIDTLKGDYLKLQAAAGKRPETDIDSSATN